MQAPLEIDEESKKVEPDQLSVYSGWRVNGAFPKFVGLDGPPSKYRGLFSKAPQNKTEWTKGTGGKLWFGEPVDLWATHVSTHRPMTRSYPIVPLQESRDTSVMVA